MKELSAIKELEGVTEIQGKPFRLDEHINPGTRLFCVRSKTPDSVHTIFEFGVDLTEKGWSSTMFRNIGNPCFEKFVNMMEFYFKMYVKCTSDPYSRMKSEEANRWEYFVLCRDDYFLENN